MKKKLLFGLVILLGITFVGSPNAIFANQSKEKIAVPGDTQYLYKTVNLPSVNKWFSGYAGGQPSGGSCFKQQSYFTYSIGGGPTVSASISIPVTYQSIFGPTVSVGVTSILCQLILYK